MRAVLLSFLLIATAQLAPGADYFLGRSIYDPLDGKPLVAGRVYDGSTADRVDEFMRKVPENSTIHFGNHLFDTRGVWDNWLGDQAKGFRLKSGWSLLGAGTNSLTGSVFRLADVPVDKSGYYNWNAVFSTGGIGMYNTNQPAQRRPNVDHVTIRDLQIDCNYRNLAKAKATPALQLAGIQILGNRGLSISNVLVRNAASKKLDGQGQQFECFQVYLYNKWANNSPGEYRIDRVAIAEYQGGYTSAICVNGDATGVVQNCTIDLASDKAQRYGLNFAAGLHHFTFSGNTVRHATRAINNDTGPACSQVTIVSNLLADCSTGMLLANSQTNQILFNSITLDGTGSGISIRCHPTLADVNSRACVVRGNTLSGPGGEGISLCYQNDFDPRDVTLYWSSHNVIQSNILSEALQSKIPPEAVAPNTVRPGNRRHNLSFPGCNRGGQANVAAVGFPSDIGPGAPCAYCEARAGDSSAGYISRVRLHDTRLDVRSDWGDGTGFTDFTTGYGPGMGKLKSKGSYYVAWADVRRGRVYRVDIQAASLGAPRPANFYVYIDWDHDGVFDSERDLVATGWSKNFVSADFIVPRNAPLGSTRMRVIMAGGTAPRPCESKSYWGEVEDYTITVVP